MIWGYPYFWHSVVFHCDVCRAWSGSATEKMTCTNQPSQPITKSVYGVMVCASIFEFQVEIYFSDRASKREITGCRSQECLFYTSQNVTLHILDISSLKMFQLVYTGQNLGKDFKKCKLHLGFPYCSSRRSVLWCFESHLSEGIAKGWVDSWNRSEK